MANECVLWPWPVSTDNGQSWAAKQAERQHQREIKEKLQEQILAVLGEKLTFLFHRKVLSDLLLPDMMYRSEWEKFSNHMSAHFNIPTNERPNNFKYKEL